MKKILLISLLMIQVIISCTSSPVKADKKKKTNKRQKTILTTLPKVQVEKVPMEKTESIHYSPYIHDDISDTFLFKTSLKLDKTDEYNNATVSIQIKNKITNKIKQNIKYKTGYLFETKSFLSNKNTRSYITGKNVNKKIIDNEYGDLIIADFNSDSKQDFAVKFDSGGNGGPLYNYYLQTVDTTFLLDKFLTNEMHFFPQEFNKKNKTITTYVHANCYQVSKTVYQFNPLTKTWKKLSKVLLGD